ncbi:ABC transporter ATP-binding protein [Streptococcus sobrinus]|uniref:ABC transporter ATP-binding protein n=1 Tax=Streptococcus sobrinus TaxID=1310 RepID=A0ABN5LGV3_9STRE|nr:ABC transporter ATP-binding protein [Streptococcus sobrinus]AWN18398.1 ABC transporter ATP-binding protein [Streptococcus sobrinus]AWN20313.1 ABC transporter ATP-binding protein [Streptococcus sobrinus]EMP70766.1 ABC transporter ATP-binding protein [Streptococcus sobrinus DSM 20742 = ATCC 33478]SQG13041.1 ABC transporter ATP-binding protein [Streptococcus sobrinus]
MFTLTNIEKTFGGTNKILQGISLSIEDGERIALLGSNGAGKTTLLKIISGQLKQNKGTINSKLDFQSEIGMMPQGDILIDDLKVKEIVNLKAYMNRLREKNIDSLLEKVDLKDQKDKFVSSLSGGQKRRLSLLLAILNNPKLIFLDEPTTGMDLESVDKFWELLKKQDVTSVIVTHDFNQIDKFFTRVLILKNGKIFADEKVEVIHQQGLTIEKFYRTINDKEI